MLAIDSHNVWIELNYDEEVTTEEFLKGIDAIYKFIKENPDEVTELFNRYMMRDNARLTINLTCMGY